jgi:anti-anti-sigma regulatory factor
MHIQKIKGVVILKLAAEDLSRPQETYKIVEQLLKRDGERCLVADLSELADLVSIQAGALFALHALCYENVAVLKLAAANKKVKLVLRLIGLDKIMELHHGREVALASFGSGEEE